MTRRVLVLGGSASGKSAFAESLLADAPVVDYVATAFERSDDVEWSARIAVHRARRPDSWRTVETLDLQGVLCGDGPPLLIDSITTWVAAAGHAEQADELCTAWAATSRTTVMVSDEVGNSVVPATENGRRFRDALGTLNQRLAAAADEVVLVVAGLPLRLK